MQIESRSCGRVHLVLIWSALLFFEMAILAACDSPSVVIWSKEVKAPDGSLIVSAATTQTSGSGINSIHTLVSIKRSPYDTRAISILGISNETALPPGITEIEIVWLNPRRLDLSYAGNATIDLQVVKVAALDISIRHRE